MNKNQESPDTVDKIDKETQTSHQDLDADDELLARWDTDQTENARRHTLGLLHSRP